MEVQARSVSESIPVQGSPWQGETLRYSFSGHETFPFRYAWLPKGIAAVHEDPKMFSRPDALVRLGVGKNMVASIRFWCETLGLIDVRREGAELTPLGRFLFGSTPAHDEDSHDSPPGADPYLEDPGTLWLLHWQLASRPHPASTWHLAFTCWSESIFTRDELTQWLLHRAQEGLAKRSSIQSIKRDVDVFLRTYLPVYEGRRNLLEDGFDCPLVELGLIRRVDRQHFSLERGPRPSLPQDVLAFALAEYWRDSAPDQETLALERVLFNPSSPGAAFRLRDRDLIEAVEGFPANFGLRYDETAGQRVIFREFKREPLEFLADYYDTALA